MRTAAISLGAVAGGLFLLMIVIDIAGAIGQFDTSLSCCLGVFALLPGGLGLLLFLVDFANRRSIAQAVAMEQQRVQLAEMTQSTAQYGVPAMRSKNSQGLYLPQPRD